MTTKTLTHFGSLAFVAVFGVMYFALAPSAQAATCTFTRDLNLGMTGEDVRCLQQYLNSNGYTIAETGPGAKGNETGEFKALTEAAVKKWQQAKGLSPVTGSFGPKSRALYQSEQGGGGTVLGAETSAATPGVSSPILQAILTRLTALERRIEALEGKKPVATPAPTTVSAPTTPSVSSGSKADRAEAAIDELDTAIAEAEDEIAEADDDGDRVDYAEELLDGVVDMLDQAQEQLDDENYDRVIVITKRALPLVAEAVDAIGKRGGDDEDEDDDEADDLEDRLDDLRDELEDARDDVEEAEDNDEDTGDAEDLLDDAEDALDDAEDALDDDDENEAEDLLDEAEDLIEEAGDEL